MKEQDKGFDAARLLEAARAIEAEAAARVAALRARLRPPPVEEFDTLELSDVELDEEPPKPAAPPPVPVARVPLEKKRAKMEPLAVIETKRADNTSRPRLPGLPPPRSAPVNPSSPPPPFKVLGRLGTVSE